MRRYTLSSRRSASTDALRDQFIKELMEESRRILAQMSQQFAQELQAQSSQMLQQLLSESSMTANNSGGTTSPAESLSKLVSATTRYLVSRPRTSSSTVETSRSAYAEQDFRLSRNQTMAEAAAALNHGEKNT